VNEIGVNQSRQLEVTRKSERFILMFDGVALMFDGVTERRTASVRQVHRAAAALKTLRLHAG
jgi:hypothetical protein